MMRIKQIITNFFTLSNPQYHISLIIKIGVIAGFFFLIYKCKPRWRNFSYFVLFVLLMRLFLFDQYFSWGFYRGHLRLDDVGWRQISVIEFEHRKFFKNIQRIKFLAVGSSQTLAVYKPYSEKHKDLIVIHLSSMAPLDYYLYRKYIVDCNPDYLLLYLSDFDLAKEPRLDAAKIAPNQGIGLLGIIPILFEISKQTHSEIDLKEMVVGEFFPEYKYSFIFKGFSEKLMKKNKALHVRSLLEALSPDAAQINRDIESMLQEMDERWISYNKYFLTKFLSYCKSKSLKIIIVEGQYNPLAYSKKSLYLNHITHQELENIAKEFDNVTFLSRPSIPQFTQDDYSDVTHIKPKVAYHFVETLVKNIK